MPLPPKEDENQRRSSSTSSSQQTKKYISSKGSAKAIQSVNLKRINEVMNTQLPTIQIDSNIENECLQILSEGANCCSQGNCLKNAANGDLNQAVEIIGCCRRSVDLMSKEEKDKWLFEMFKRSLIKNDSSTGSDSIRENSFQNGLFLSKSKIL